MQTHGKLRFVTGGLLFFALVACSLAASDPSIRDWGTDPTLASWQSPDVWVDNNGNGTHNEPGEPSKGMINRLFGRIRNLGSTTASNVTVKFAYAPFGLWGWSSYSDFKLIDSVGGITLDPAGTSGSEKLIEVQWDMRDLSENNGGNWGGHTVGEFDHFCVWVTVVQSVDANTGNNHARNNFMEVETSAGEPFMLKFIVPNPKRKPAKAQLLLKGLPSTWKSNVRGIDNLKSFELKPKEFRLVTLTLTPPKEDGRKVTQQQTVDVALKLDQEIVGGISFQTTPVKAEPFTPADGMLSPYIIGTYDNRENLETVLQVINPTGKNLDIFAVFFDDNEKPLRCVKNKLSPNDMVEIEVRSLKLEAKVGVVKIVSMSPRTGKPDPGIVGYKRTINEKKLVSETILHSIPTPILEGDLKYIMKACQ